MRDVLFRGQSGDGEWIHGFYNFQDYLFNGEQVRRHYMRPVNAQDSVLILPETLGQYSGRTDLKRKRIFEGDIVKLTILGGNEFITVCTFEEGAFGLRWTWQGVERFAAFTSICNALFEVVGNVYDNPEKLKEADADG